MTRLRFQITCLCWLLLTAVATAEKPVDKTAAPPEHLQAVFDLLEQVRPENSSYEHHHGSVNWGTADGRARYECHTDCSGLLNHVFEHVYHLNREDMRSWLGADRPHARTYHQAIAMQNRFRRIGYAQQMKPGDIIAVRYPPGSKNTGHIMIVAEPPKPRRPTEPQLAGTLQWDVRIIDSTGSAHGKSDSRLRADGRFNAGIGEGLLRLYTDRDGRVVGHTWSNAPGSTFHGQSERNIEVGRLTPPRA